MNIENEIKSCKKQFKEQSDIYCLGGIIDTLDKLLVDFDKDDNKANEQKVKSFEKLIDKKSLKANKIDINNRVKTKFALTIQKLMYPHNAKSLNIDDVINKYNRFTGSIAKVDFPIVLICGGVGAGKSTFFNTQFDCKYKSVKRRGGDVILEPTTPEISLSGTGIDRTTKMSCYRQIRKLYLVDTPGFEKNKKSKGSFEINMYNIIHAKSLKKVACIYLMIIWSHLKNKDANLSETIDAFASLYGKSLKNYPKGKKIIRIIISKPLVDDDEYLKEELERVFQNLSNDGEEKYRIIYDYCDFSKTIVFDIKKDIDLDLEFKEVYDISNSNAKLDLETHQSLEFSLTKYINELIPYFLESGTITGELKKLNDILKRLDNDLIMYKNYLTKVDAIKIHRFIGEQDVNLVDIKSKYYKIRSDTEKLSRQFNSDLYLKVKEMMDMENELVKEVDLKEAGNEKFDFMEVVDPSQFEEYKRNANSRISLKKPEFKVKLYKSYRNKPDYIELKNKLESKINACTVNINDLDKGLKDFKEQLNQFVLETENLNKSYTNLRKRKEDLLKLLHDFVLFLETRKVNISNEYETLNSILDKRSTLQYDKKIDSLRKMRKDLDLRNESEIILGRFKGIIENEKFYRATIKQAQPNF